MAHIHGLLGSAKALDIAKNADPNKKYLVITKDELSSELFYGDLRLFFSEVLSEVTSEDNVFHYPAWDILPFEQSSPDINVSAKRIYSRIKFNSANNGIFITSIQALIQNVISLNILNKLKINLKINQEISKAKLIRKFEIAGFQKVRMVENLGEFSTHGDILDFYAFGEKSPIRINFSHTEIVKLKYFNTKDQRSFEEIKFFEILPLREFCPFTNESPLQNKLSDALLRLKKNANKRDCPISEREVFERELENEDYFNASESIFSIVSNEFNTLYDELKKINNIFLIDKLGIETAYEDFELIINEREEKAVLNQLLLPNSTQLFTNYTKFNSFLQKKEIRYLDGLEVNTEEINKINESIHYTCYTNSEIRNILTTSIGSGNAYEPLKNWLIPWLNKDFKIAFFIGSKIRANKLIEILNELELEANYIENYSLLKWITLKQKINLGVFQGNLSQGVNIIQDKIILISEDDIFTKRSKRTKKKKEKEFHLKKLMESLSELQPQDYVVHEDYGIGIYQGLQLKKIENEESDFLQIDYADSSIYLPIQHIGKIQKYRSKEGTEPELNKLSSKKWEKTKRKVKDQLVALAGDLIKLYAEREEVKGWRFEPYGGDDENFADEFPFNETHDQLNAIEATIEDMSIPKPMDRLICGDVGFGKTEVAIRATYKCLQHSRQVAILAPTTILVEQHFQTFKERFKNYPFEVRALSRFYGTKENNKTIARLLSGQVDIVIGTHKLLSNNIEFKDLGLLVIDEEQRFGVKQKEKLKKFKKEVDVLTLTATPIPRTLHMALLKIRDVSVITTPPTDRLNVKTYVATRSENLIREAILRELKRQGQVFFLHNRIQSIEIILAGLKELVPEARIVFAHGQMNEKQLEDIMSQFIRKEFDVLLSTSIIESGIDIPNANTIIIDRSDMFGLAQLYQLRGRVGRSDRQAYCYFLVPPRKKMSEDAQRRLKVMQSINSLGQGFELALRDLEIRGAGNLLGKEQAGNVISVGYELYTKILKEAVLNLKGEEEELKNLIDPDVKLGVPAYIPDEYIPDISERLIMYQRLANIITDNEAKELAEEIYDRFGPTCIEVDNLIEVMRIRGLLREFGVNRLERRGEKLIIAFHNKAQIDIEKLMQLATLRPKKFKLGKSLNLHIKITEKQEENILLNLYIDLLRTLREISLD